MDKTDVPALITDLAANTEYGKFLKLWPQIKEARANQVKMIAIHKTLVDAKAISVSYPTFTRFVKTQQDK